MSTEMRFIPGSSGLPAVAGGDVPAQRHLDGSRPAGPLGPESVNVDFQVVGGRVTWWQVLGLDERRAARAVKLQDPAPGRVGSKGELILGRVDERPVDLGGVTVVDECAGLVVLAGRGQVMTAPPAQPPFLIQVDLEILGHRDLHRPASWAVSSVSSMSPPWVSCTRHPAGSSMVKNGPSMISSPVPSAPGGWSARTATGTLRWLPSAPVRSRTPAQTSSARCAFPVSGRCGCGSTEVTSSWSRPPGPASSAAAAAPGPGSAVGWPPPAAAADRIDQGSSQRARAIPPAQKAPP